MKGMNTRHILGRCWMSLQKHRVFLNGSFLEYLAITLLLFVLACIYTNFVIFHISSQLFVDSPGDATAGFLWLNFADPGISPFLSKTTMVNFPVGEQLESPTFITYSALWLPVRFFAFIFGPIAGLNVMMFIGIVGGGLGAYWLVKRLTSAKLVSLFAGIAIAFVPYNLYNSSSHLAYIFSIVFIFMLAAFVALWLRPNWKRAVLFAATVALAFYTDGYYLLLASVMTVGLAIAGVVYAIIKGFRWREYKIRIQMALVALVSLVIFCIPIGFVQLTQGSNVQSTLNANRTDISNEIHAYQSKLMDFILPSPTNSLFEWTGQSKNLTTYKNLRSNPTESMTYVGFTIIVLAVIGLVILGVWLVLRKYSSLTKIPQSNFDKYLLVGCVVLITTPLFLSFMLSPSIAVHGHTIYLPGQFLINHNISLWRVLARFFIPLHAVLVIFAAFTLWVITRCAKTFHTRQYLRVGIVGVLILGMMVEYLTGIYRPSFDFSKAPESYQWLAHQKNIKTIAEFPMVDPLDAHTTNYITYQVVDHKNLVNPREPSIDRLSNVLGSTNNPEAIDFAYGRGAQAIVTHDQSCQASFSWGVLIHKSKDKPKGEVCIYRLNRPVSNDPLFAVYGDGFQYYPNQPTKTLELAAFVKNDGVITITNGLFATPPKGRATLKAEIHDFHNNRVNGTWTVEQSGAVLTSGRVTNSKAVLSAIVDTTKPVHVELTPDPNSLLRPNDLYMSNLVVTAL